MIKLAKLPDRTPVKLMISVPPALADDLSAYAEIYSQIYGRTETMGDLIPAILVAFLESDREFVRRKKAVPQIPS